MTRKPDPKAQAEILMADLAKLGFTLNRGKALDLVAKLEGFRGWNELSKARKAADAAARALASATVANTLGYAFEIPQALVDENGEIDGDRLAGFLKHKKKLNERSAARHQQQWPAPRPVECLRWAERWAVARGSLLLG